MLNLGVAMWWLLRPDADPPAAWIPPADVPRLQLLEERGTAALRADTTDATRGGAVPADAQSEPPDTESDDGTGDRSSAGSRAGSSAGSSAGVRPPAADGVGTPPADNAPTDAPR